MEYMYGALLLHKLGKEVNEETLKSVVTAAGADVDESKMKSLVASLKGVNIDEELENASVAVAAPTGGDAGAEEKKEEAQKEEKKEASAEGLSALFG